MYVFRGRVRKGEVIEMKFASEIAAITYANANQDEYLEFVIIDTECDNKIVHADSYTRLRMSISKHLYCMDELLDPKNFCDN